MSNWLMWSTTLLFFCFNYYIVNDCLCKKFSKEVNPCTVRDLRTVLSLDTAYMRIFVSDINDNAPMFPLQRYETSVEEDKDVGYVVITVSAVDEDEGEV